MNHMNVTFQSRSVFANLILTTGLLFAAGGTLVLLGAGIANLTYQPRFLRPRDDAGNLSGIRAATCPHRIGRGSGIAAT
jgi:hypothetical protein